MDIKNNLLLQLNITKEEYSELIDNFDTVYTEFAKNNQLNKISSLMVLKNALVLSAQNDF